MSRKVSKRFEKGSACHYCCQGEEESSVGITIADSVSIEYYKLFSVAVK